MSLGANIRALREAKQWSTHRLAAEAETHQSSIWRFESDEVRPRTKTLGKLAAALGVEPAYLEYGNAEQLGYSPYRVNIEANRKRIRLFDLTQADLDISSESLKIDDVSPVAYVWRSIGFSDMAFAITFRGDSMLPEFREGDIVTVEPDKPLHPGDFVVAREKANDRETVLRQFVHLRSNAKDGHVMELRPLNPDYPNWVSSEKDFEVLGVVMEVSRDIYQKK